ncbi:MAG: hypothetical protein RL698_1145 [Pseudomonadota bacterium]|jgi:steroid 5-alpha reductase family enzyme
MIPWNEHAALTLAVTAAVFFLLWLVSLRLRDASIVDSWWGPGFALVALVSFLLTPGGARPRRLLVLALTATWGLRLGAHIFLRNAGQPEDARYQAMRRRWGDRFPLASLVTVFAFQAVILWIVSAPVQAAQRSAVPATLGAWDAAGIAVWAIGLFFEAVGDAQLARFRADPANAARVMDRGLWRYTRHPNYFGDACAWWGLWLVACAVPGGWATVFSPVLMTWLLRRVSGVPMLERGLAKRRPGYEEYVRRTSPFLPRPPRI